MQSLRPLVPLVSEIQGILSSISSNSENGHLIMDKVYTMALKICFTDKLVGLFTGQRSWAYMELESKDVTPNNMVFEPYCSENEYRF